jgi:hypothetical protein
MLCTCVHAKHAHMYTVDIFNENLSIFELMYIMLEGELVLYLFKHHAIGASVILEVHCSIRQRQVVTSIHWLLYPFGMSPQPVPI